MMPKGKWIFAVLAVAALSAVVVAEVNRGPDEQPTAQAVTLNEKSGCCWTKAVAALVSAEPQEKTCCSAETAIAPAESGCCSKTSQTAAVGGACCSKVVQTSSADVAACPVEGCPVEGCASGGCGDGLEAVLTSVSSGGCTAGDSDSGTCESGGCPFAEPASAEKTCCSEKAACCSTEKACCSEAGGCGGEKQADADDNLETEAADAEVASK